MTILFKVIRLFFVGWMAVSLVVVAYLTIDPEMQFLRARRGLRRLVCWNWDGWKFFFYAGVFMGVAASVIVIEPLLFFIPESWGGYDEDGELISTRFRLAMLIAFVAALVIGELLSNYGKRRVENKKRIDMNPGDDGLSHSFTDIIEQHLRDVTTYNSRGNSHVHRGEYDRAISDFTRATEIDPGYPETHYNLGYTYLQTGKKDLALREYAILETLDEELAGKLRRKLEQDQAILDQTKAIEANPESPGVGRNYFLRGTAYYNKGQYDRAIDDYSNAIEHDAMFLGWIATPGHIGWDDETQRQIQLNPETEEAFRLDVIKNTHQHQRYPFDYYYRASAHYAKGEYDKAIMDYTKTIEIDTDMAAAHYRLAKVYLKTGNKALALEEYEVLITLDEDLANELHGLIQKHLTTQRNC